MGSYSWATDIHLDFLRDNQQIIDFGESLVASSPDGVFLTGDISTAPLLGYHLSALERICQRPIHFVLGNHDYYRGDIATVRKMMNELTNASQYLRYLPLVPYVTLSPSTALVGHDGWYDGLNGKGAKSQMRLNDWKAIREFAQLPRNNGELNMTEIVAQAQKLAHAGTMHVMNGIKAASRYHKNIIIMTHFPPFEGSHVHEGNPGDPDALPWYTSKMMGDMLTNAAQTFPNIKFTILSGHTHGQYDGQVAKNMTVHVGGADYGRPGLQRVIEVP